MEERLANDAVVCSERQACRVCGAEALRPFFHLGEMPLANGFLTPDALSQPEGRYPLEIAVCDQCWLAQLMHVVQPDILFRNYPYFSSASAPLVKHFESLARIVKDRFLAQPDDLVVEIGSNDGVFLQWLRGSARLLGIDPAMNVNAAANANAIETLPEFFTNTMAHRLGKHYGQAAVIVAANVVAHVDDLDDFLRGVVLLLRDDGVFVFEVHWVDDLLTHHGFDQIYHEHVSYFGLHQLRRALERAGLMVFEAAIVPNHGQSLRVFGAHRGQRTPAPSVSEVAAVEVASGLNGFARYRTFETSADGIRAALQAMLGELRASGKRIAGYGAPAKGNMMLNYCRLGPETVEYLIDTTPAKQGLFTPGVRVPIRSPDYARQSPPDYFILFAWNYADAILEKEREFRARGGKFIIPIPEPRIV